MNVAMILKAKGTEVVTIPPSTLLSEVASLLTKRRIGAVLVMDGPRIVGIVSERDIVKTIAYMGADALNMPVTDVMTPHVITCELHDSVDELMDSMTESRFRHLPVVEEGKLVGIVSIGDVVKHRIAETVMETEALKLYIANA